MWCISINKFIIGITIETHGKDGIRGADSTVLFDVMAHMLDIIPSYMKSYLL